MTSDIGSFQSLIYINDIELNDLRIIICLSKS